VFTGETTFYDIINNGMMEDWNDGKDLEKRQGT